jgi:alkylhydroperoxidase family enzyme
MTLATALGGTDALARLDAAHAAAWRATDPALLGVCHRRVGMLLGAASIVDAMSVDDQRDLAAWPTSSSFDDTEKAALAFTEHYVIDVASMPDDVVFALCERLGDAGLVDFVNALLVVEQRMTLEIGLEAVL